MIWLDAVKFVAEEIKEIPELVEAVDDYFGDLRAGADPTPAMRRLEAIEAARKLGIDPSGL